jgi:mannose-1-phosphate guanylyltransferase
VWTLPVLRKAYEDYLPAIAESFLHTPLPALRSQLEEVYSQCEAISVDHGIMEKADNVHVLAASFGWSDVETWDSLYDVSTHDHNGNAILCGNVFTYDTRNSLVVMPDDCTKTVVLEGLDGYIVAANENTLMVCRRKSEEQVFRFANDVELKKLIDKK